MIRRRSHVIAHDTIIADGGATNSPWAFVNRELFGTGRARSRGSGSGKRGEIVAAEGSLIRQS